MIDDPILIRLVGEAAQAAARVQAYLVSHEPPDDELIPLNRAAELFRRSIDTMRRWAKVEGFGVKIDGVWFLRRSMLILHGKI